MTLSRKIAEVLMKKNVPVDAVVETLRSYKLLSLLPSIKKNLEKFSRTQNEESRIHVESPYPLSGEALAHIKRVAGNDLADTDVTINQELLAGFKARWKGKLYDGSAQRIIRQLLNK